MPDTREAVEARSGAPGPPRPEELAYRLHQQADLADFGRRALAASTLDDLLNAATQLCADGMHARYCKALEHLPDRNALLLRAGVGWAPGFVGQEMLDLETPAGLAFRSGAPVVSNHLDEEERFRTPPLLSEHGVKRTVSVPVPLSNGKTWGALAADSPDESGRWDEADVEFMSAMARLLGMAIERQEAMRQAEEGAALIRLSQDAIIVWRPPGVVESWNVGAETLYGYSRDEAVGQNLAELLNDRLIPSGEVTEDLRQRGSWAGELRHTGKDGRKIDVSARLQRVIGADGAERILEVTRDITERKRMDEALQASRASWIAIVNTVDQMIWITRSDGFHEYFNRRWYEFTGAAPGSTDGDGWTQLLHPGDRESTFAAWRASLASGEPYEVEYRLRHRSGVYRWMLGRAHPIHDETGRIIRWIGTCTDIHEQKQFGERLRLLYQAQPPAYLVLAPDFTIEDASEPYLRMTMSRAEDLIGRVLFDVFPDSDEPTATGVRRLRASLQRVLQTRAPDHMPVLRYDIRRPTGEFEVRWWSPVNVPVLGPDGEVLHIIYQVEDVTAEMLERQRAAEARAGEARFRAVAETLPGLVFETDAEGRNTYANGPFLAYTGLASRELRENWGDIVHPDDRAEAAAAWAEAMRSTSVYETETRLHRADGAWRWFMVRASPFLDENGRVDRWVGICTDITEQREAIELQLTLLQEVSHRVKNSLALVASLLKLQARSLQGAARDALEEAYQRVHAVAGVHDLLWRGVGTRQIDLQPFLTDLSAAVAAASPRHKTVCHAEPALVSADMAVPLGLLVNELLTNAYKHAYAEGQEGEVLVRGTAVAERRYRLEVVDRGRGLPRGFNLDTTRESLGMRVITSLAAQLGGSLTAESAKPGARFTLVFPREG